MKKQAKGKALPALSVILIKTLQYKPRHPPKTTIPNKQILMVSSSKLKAEIKTSGLIKERRLQRLLAFLLSTLITLMKTETTVSNLEAKFAFLDQV